MPQNVDEVWKGCLSALADQLAPQIYRTWFLPIAPISLDVDSNGAHLKLKVPSRFFYEWLERRYTKTLAETVDRVVGLHTEISFRVDATTPHLQEEEVVHAPRHASSRHTPSAPRVPGRAGELIATGSVRRPSPASSQQHQHQLNPSYTFDTYIEGDCNRLARSAAQAIADNPAKTSFNPFLIYGGVGLGKTHLAQAIGNYAIANGWQGRCLYVSSERFTAQFVHAIQENRVSDFTRHYRQIDLLIVDDIQFFGKKEKTQEEFFHIFNDLHQSGRQIVLSADRPPREIEGIEERLLSRFQWGLTADVQAPDLETRIAILQRNALASNFDLDADVISFVAERIKTNVRQLEGALVRLAAHANLHKRKIDLDFAQEVLRDLVDHHPGTVDIEEIKKAVASYYNTALDLLSAKTRRREVVQARQIAMYCCKQLTNQPLKTIGLRFGGRDHSTVIHACRSVENRLDTEPQFKYELERIQSDLTLRRNTG